MPKWMRELDRLVRGDATRISVLRQGGIDVTSDALQIAIVVLGLVYGVCMGTYCLLKGDATAWLQFFSGIVKVPALFLLTLLVTFPSLYVFNALVGSRLPLAALWRLLMSSMAITLAVLASFGPIVAFFSVSTTSYSFMLLLNVLVCGASGILGLKFLMQTLHRLSVLDSNSKQMSDDATEKTEPEGALDTLDGQVLGPHLRFVFRVWILVFALVGAQMSWILRPFLGSPEKPFEFLRSRESNFFEAVWQHIVNLFH